MRAVVLGSMLFGCTLAGASYAAAAGPAELVAARVAGYKQIAKANKAVQDELKKSEPSLALVRSNAATLETLGRRIPGWFPRGSGPQPGLKTAALPAIWQQAPKFRQSAANLANASNALGRAAAGGDLPRARIAAAVVGQTCKACHDSFREKK